MLVLLNHKVLSDVKGFLFRVVASIPQQNPKLSTVKGKQVTQCKPMEISRTGTERAAGEGCLHISAGGKQTGVVSGPGGVEGAQWLAPTLEARATAGSGGSGEQTTH